MLLNKKEDSSTLAFNSKYRPLSAKMLSISKSRLGLNNIITFFECVVPEHCSRKNFV